MSIFLCFIIRIHLKQTILKLKIRKINYTYIQFAKANEQDQVIILSKG